VLVCLATAYTRPARLPKRLTSSTSVRRLRDSSYLMNPCLPRRCSERSEVLLRAGPPERGRQPAHARELGDDARPTVAAMRALCEMARWRLWEALSDANPCSSGTPRMSAHWPSSVRKPGGLDGCRWTRAGRPAARHRNKAPTAVSSTAVLRTVLRRRSLSEKRGGRHAQVAVTLQPDIAELQYEYVAALVAPRATTTSPLSRWQT